MTTRSLNKIYVQCKQQWQASDVVFLICDTKFVMVGAVLSCKEFHIFGCCNTVHSPYFGMSDKDYHNFFSEEHVSSY